MNKNKYVMGIDIGGSHITVAVLDMQQRNILKNSYTRERVDSHGSTTQIIHTWCNAIKAGYKKQVSRLTAWASPCQGLSIMLMASLILPAMINTLLFMA